MKQLLNKNVFRKLDFQHIAVFVSLFETKNAKQTSYALNISQPTVSYCLKKLRECFDDPLFIVTGNGFTPTLQAQEIEPYLRNVIEALNTASSLQEPTSILKDRTIRLCAPEYFEQLILPKLAKQVNDSSLNASIRLDRLGQELPIEQLFAGKLDMIIGLGPGYHRLHPSLDWQSIMEDRFVCLSKSNTEREITLDEYCQVKHVYPTPWLSQNNMIDSWLEKLGLTRQIAIRASTYQGCINILAETPYMLMLPERLINVLLIPSTIKVHQAPPGAPNFTLDLMWERKSANKPLATWLRKQLISIGQSL